MPRQLFHHQQSLLQAFKLAPVLLLLLLLLLL
jgi:hypothetical protein